ncbi:MAG: DUF4349 domain-containing protein [Clostridiales bacterium]|nr:DUF4349 domain-containing protein [Clostridiales bacterium]
MKRNRLLLALTSLLIILAITTTACASKKADYEGRSGSSGQNYYNYAYDENDTGSTSSDKAEEKPAGFGSEKFQSTAAEPVQSQDKIIRTFNLTIETMEFDSLISRIESEISRLGGYVESSNISGKRYYDSGARHGSIVARVPSDRVDEFVNIVGDNANVVNSQKSSTNVSLEYIDTESRIKALKIEQERLYAILEKELNLENIITLESRLSDIRYELQNYESKLRYFDNQVTYSTVTMNIYEVEKLSPKVEIKQSIGTRIKNGLSDTFYNITEGFKNFIVWFVVNLPYILIWAIIIAIAILLLRRLIRGLNPYGEPRKKNGNKGKRMDNKPEIDPDNLEDTGEYTEEDNIEEDSKNQ